MLKNKLDFKLINLALITIIIFFMYQTGSLWNGVFHTIIKIIAPFFVGFAVAYALYPILRFLQSKKIPKGIGIFLILGVLIGTIAVISVLIGPMLFQQLSSLFNGIIAFCKELTTNYNIDLGGIQASLSEVFNKIIVDLGEYVSNGAMDVIGVSINYISFIFIAFAAAIYILSDMEQIRTSTKHFLLKKSKRSYLFVRRLDNEMQNYLEGFLKIMIISLFEYTIAFYIIGHPNAILLGVLAAFGNLIPYFGGIFTNIIAAITAFVISPSLFIRTIIAFFILSNLDGYVINPLVYGKSNQLHPLITIFAVFAGGILWGVAGIVFALPLSILLITTFKFYQNDINEKLDDFKEKKRKRTFPK